MNKNLTKKILTATILSSVFSVSGCAHRIADLTVGSTKNINLNSKSFASGEYVEGDDYIPVVLFSFGIPNIENAIDDAMNQDKCIVGLTNLTLEVVDQSFIIGRKGYRVKGEALYDLEKPGCSRTASNQKLTKN